VALSRGTGAQNLKSHIQRKGSNRTRSRIRVRAERIFGAQADDSGGTSVRTIGTVRAKAKIGMKTLAYNMRHLVQLRRLSPCPAGSGAA
jgi:hypothetical protein